MCTYEGAMIGGRNSVNLYKRAHISLSRFMPFVLVEKEIGTRSYEHVFTGGRSGSVGRNEMVCAA